LFELLDSDEDSDATRTALREIDAVAPEALPVLLEALKGEGRRQRYYAVFFLGKLGPEAKEALPVLEEALQSESGRFRDSLQRAIDAIKGKPADDE
jgi:HEAT repeat protein